MLVGEVPFRAKHDYQTFKLILEGHFVFPEGLDEEAKDLIAKLLNPSPDIRLGCGPQGAVNDMNALKAHPFFKYIDFQNLHSTSPPVPMHKMSDYFKSNHPKK